MNRQRILECFKYKMRLYIYNSMDILKNHGTLPIKFLPAEFQSWVSTPPPPKMILNFLDSWMGCPSYFQQTSFTLGCCSRTRFGPGQDWADPVGRFFSYENDGWLGEDKKSNVPWKVLSVRSSWFQREPVFARKPSPATKKRSNKGVSIGRILPKWLKTTQQFSLGMSTTITHDGLS